MSPIIIIIIAVNLVASLASMRTHTYVVTLVQAKLRTHNNIIIMHGHLIYNIIIITIDLDIFTGKIFHLLNFASLILLMTKISQSTVLYPGHCGTLKFS